MREEPNFEIFFTEEVMKFLSELDDQTKCKILYNITKAQYVNDPELFKKLGNSSIWEFRTLYNKIQYRLLAFWEPNKEASVVITHGFIKKSAKTPPKEIQKAAVIKNNYLDELKKEKKQ